MTSVIAKDAQMNLMTLHLTFNKEKILGFSQATKLQEVVAKSVIERMHSNSISLALEHGLCFTNLSNDF
jgi:hypothetical protein